MQENEVILTALKERFFKLMATEDIGKTPKVTAEIDALQAKIREMEQVKVVAS